MSIYEFNQELYDEGLREEGMEAGKELGDLSRLILQISKKSRNINP